MERQNQSRISIQVSLSGYSFAIEEGSRAWASGWMGAERLFTTPEFQKRYDEVEISLFTPKCTLVPEPFFSPSTARQILSEVSPLRQTDQVAYVSIPSFASVLVYSPSIDESLSRVIAQTVLRSDGTAAEVLPEMFFLLRDLPDCPDYNRIVCSFRDGYLYLVIAQGKSLLLANVYEAADFTTAEYFIFLALKKLQLNPEISTITLRTPVSDEEELSLYRYFKSVDKL
ncbi:MAG: DUF3822 family protein [Bacteroidales bacterium]|nr:DUF3822 family protein [Bacteroidales bacterium]